MVSPSITRTGLPVFEAVTIAIESRTMAIPAICMRVRCSPAIIQPRSRATTGLSKPRKAVVPAGSRAIP